MYTVRVQRADLSHTLPCAQYTLTRGTNRVLTLYAADGPLQGQVPLLTAAIDNGELDAVFIMNSDGHTIDTIRPRRPR